MSASPSLSPRDRHLDEVITSLAAQLHPRAVIRLVETWAAAGTPTRQARYHEARAFFHLRLMDRAMARAREVVDAAPDDAQAQRLLAEIYIERGWPSHARKIIQMLRDHPGSPGADSAEGRAELDAIWERAQAEPVRLSAQAQSIEAGGDPVRLQQLAEYFLTTGSYFRARSLLERLRRGAPEDGRVLDLLWGLDGNFLDKERGLDALVEECSALVRRNTPTGAPTGLPEGLAVAQAGALPEEAEHTEADELQPRGTGSGNAGFGHAESEHAESEHAESEHTESARSGAADGPEGASFPALFKHSLRPARADDGGDQTASFSLASREEMIAANDSTDPGMQVAPIHVARVEDTQIMLVLRPGEKQGNRPMHIRREEGGRDSLRETLNLREWQQSMGVLPTGGFPTSGAGRDGAGRDGAGRDSAGRDGGRYGAGRETGSDIERERDREQEENVVVVKRAAPAEPLPAEPSGLRKRPIEVVEKIPLPPPPAQVEAEADPEPEYTGEHPAQPPAPDMKAVTRVLALLGALMFLGLFSLLALAFYLRG